jgi:hypothetical protein
VWRDPDWDRMRYLTCSMQINVIVQNLRTRFLEWHCSAVSWGCYKVVLKNFVKCW